MRAFATGSGDAYTATYAMIDEADLVQDLKVMVDSIKPTIDAGGKLVMVGRSDERRHNTYFKKIIKDAFKGANNYVGFFTGWQERPDRDEAWYQQRLLEVGDKYTMHKQYPRTLAEALERSPVGKIYPTWSTDNITKLAEYEPNYPVYWFVDDGYTNQRVILFFQERPVTGYTGNRFVVFDEYCVTKRTSDQTLIEVLGFQQGVQPTQAPYKAQDRYTSYKTPTIVYHDPSAAEFAATCQSRGLHTWGAYNDVYEGIKIVRKCILDANGQRLLLVHPRCVVLDEQMRAYREKETGTASKGGDMAPVKEDDHTCDALRYGLATRYQHTI